jgi:hypothetical protein
MATWMRVDRCLRLPARYAAATGSVSDVTRLSYAMPKRLPAAVSVETAHVGSSGVFFVRIVLLQHFTITVTNEYPPTRQGGDAPGSSMAARFWGCWPPPIHGAQP